MIVEELMVIVTIMDLLHQKNAKDLTMRLKLVRIIISSLNNHSKARRKRNRIQIHLQVLRIRHLWKIRSSNMWKIWQRRIPILRKRWRISNTRHLLLAMWWSKVLLLLLRNLLRNKRANLNQVAVACLVMFKRPQKVLSQLWILRKSQRLKKLLLVVALRPEALREAGKAVILQKANQFLVNVRPSRLQISSSHVLMRSLSRKRSYQR